MAKKNKTLNILSWSVGILVSLAVGFGMIGQTLTIPTIPSMIGVAIGWAIVVVTVLGGITAGAKKF